LSGPRIQAGLMRILALKMIEVVIKGGVILGIAAGAGRSGR